TSLGGGQSLRELLEAAQAGGIEAADHRAPAVGQADALHPAIFLILSPLSEAAADEVVDHPARRGQRYVDALGSLLEGELARLVLEVVQELDLRERELER